ncbi:DNA mismatch repair protein MutT [Planococcus salinarum]|uniref:DNA mismatch repair protein MutT n=1 Tax=Planococcus salinarum TaxID=622695 RepID=A0ABX3D154_9BACL|nr:NUDIX domain-containing protein [Planococcus salinarum]OHX52515.1 DNA mismatch repair protein MutT [Planococcus salinarum]TAA72249.1 NUDIX domain-containing protein [Planococcus salinarum]
MENQAYANWGGHVVSLTWLPQKMLEQSDIVTSVHGYCFLEDKIVLVHVDGRGFHVPGGHMEAHETPEETLHREAYEEACVTGDIKYIGAIQVDHTENEKFVENGKYPRIGYQLFYRMDITECLPFRREHETLSRIWVEPEEAPYVMEDHEIALLVLKEALNNKEENGVTLKT